MSDLHPLTAEEEAGLEALFVAARAEDSPPSQALTARVLIDAEAAMPRPAPAPVPGGGWDFLGGWRGMLTLAGAAAAGVMVGYLDPAALDLADPLADPLAVVEAAGEAETGDLLADDFWVES